MGLGRAEQIARERSGRGRCPADERGLDPLLLELHLLCRDLSLLCLLKGVRVVFEDLAALHGLHGPVLVQYPLTGAGVQVGETLPVPHAEVLGQAVACRLR